MSVLTSDRHRHNKSCHICTDCRLGVNIGPRTSRIGALEVCFPPMIAPPSCRSGRGNTQNTNVRRTAGLDRFRHHGGQQGTADGVRGFCYDGGTHGRRWYCRRWSVRPLSTILMPRRWSLPLGGVTDQMVGQVEVPFRPQRMTPMDDRRQEVNGVCRRYRWVAVRWSEVVGTAGGRSGHDGHGGGSFLSFLLLLELLAWPCFA